MKKLEFTALAAAAGFVLPLVAGPLEAEMCRDGRPVSECHQQRARPKSPPERPIMPPQELLRMTISSSATATDKLDWYMPLSEPVRPEPTTVNSGSVVGPDQFGSTAS